MKGCETSEFINKNMKTEINLPENAFRELKEGEEYKPVMNPRDGYPEVTAWSVIWGVLMAILFSAAAAYLGLKVGQVFEAAIPIAIIAVGVSAAAKRNKALGENVIIQSIGACSGAVVAGAIFTLPAIYILESKLHDPALSASFLQIFVASALGGILGILFLIPFRKYFVKDMHGKYPFPEATATTQVLVSGEKGGSQAKPLLIAGLVGGLYDFIVASLGWWNSEFTSRVTGFGETIAEKTKLVFKIDTGAAIVGLGYIVGLKYAFIICLGSFAVWWLIVPGMSLLFHDTVLNVGGSTASIIKSWGVIKSAVGLAAKEIKGAEKSNNTEESKNSEATVSADLPYKFIGIASILAVIATFVFLWLGVMNNLIFAIVAILLVTIIAFLFTTVAANAIAIVGSNPVSGMTLMTLILASVVMAAIGMSGSGGMLAALIMGSVVCTALSVAGSFITDLKIGYWLGTTPRKQESWKFLGTLVSAATVGGVMMLLNDTYGFDPSREGHLVAPQANAMAAVIEPMMNGAGAPWALYGIGALIAVVLDRCKIPALAFALGMFIPLQLNVPLLVGGAINWFVTSRSKDEQRNKERGERGTLIASGFIAGGALMGVVSALLKFGGVDLINTVWLENPMSQVCSLIAYILLIAYFIQATKKKA